MSGGISGLGGTKDKIAMFHTEDPREELLKYKTRLRISIHVLVVVFTS